MIIFKPSPQITSLYGLKEISLKLEAFLKELTEVLTPMSLVPVTMPVSSLFGKFSDYRFQEYKRFVWTPQRDPSGRAIRLKDCLLKNAKLLLVPSLGIVAEIIDQILKEEPQTGRVFNLINQYSAFITLYIVRSESHSSIFLQ